MKIKLTARPLNSEEMKEFGVFVSHSNDSRLFEEVCLAFERAGIPHLVDKQIEIASLNFADEIKRLIDKSNCAVVVVTKGSVESAWVNFEIGILQGEGKRVFLYDPEGLLRTAQSHFHLDSFPVFRELEELVTAVRESGFLASLFNHDTEKLSRRTFETLTRQRAVPVKLTVTLPGMASLELTECRFFVLVINFGSYEEKYGGDGLCFQSLDECGCPVGNGFCALNVMPDVDACPECVTLNKVLDNAIVSGDDVTVVLPLHRVYGTSFKMFAQVGDSKQGDRLFALMKELNLMPSLSKSGNGQRIYFSLPDSNWQGVFRLKGEFSDNFICPGASENDSDD